ncbi:sialidase family protein [Noviherbaspirillum sp. CPCC 100848]|uniref:Sialidase family protein n=1 Tax=Noviherbaspirillum album TaxID=3080276 RepID=A0ABU6JDK7_9BURK|nr:sialidase family protein [Noviherbaspirillum sp. CPCC 100848]MEC4721620.1 sialidase family protein [Noviherbaspirillum sp. CPCC 100848]
MLASLNSSALPLTAARWPCFRLGECKAFVLSCIIACLAPGAAASSSKAAEMEVAWRDSVAVAEGGGEKGPWQQNDSRYSYVDDATVSLDPQGNAAVAWVDQARKDVFFRLIPAAGTKAEEGASVNVSRSASTFSWLPRIERAPDAPHRIYVLWQEIIFSGGSHGGDMLIARSEDNGVSFSPPLNVSESIGGDGKGRINSKVWHNGSQDLVAGPGGLLYFAWTEYDGMLWFSRSNDGGRSFTRPQRIAGGGQARPVRAPSLALAEDGAVYLAWTTGEDDGADIHVAKSVDGGESFGAPVIVAPTDRYADAPKLAAGPGGVLHLAYAQSEGGPFARHAIRYTQSSDGGRSFRAPMEVAAPATTPTSMTGRGKSLHFPSLALDGLGRVMIVYEQFPDVRRDPRGLGFVLSSDGGRSFSAPMPVPHSADPKGGTNGSHQGRLMEKLALDRDGRIAVANTSLLQGRQSRAWLIRGQLVPARREK